MHAQAGIDHGGGAFAHAAGADWVVNGGAEILEILCQLFVRPHVRARQGFHRTVLRDGGGGKDLPREPRAGEQHLDVGRGGKIIWRNDRFCEGIGRTGHNGASAIGPHRADGDGHAVFPLQVAQPAGVVTGGGEQ